MAEITIKLEFGDEDRKLLQGILTALTSSTASVAVTETPAEKPVAKPAAKPAAKPKPATKPKPAPEPEPEPEDDDFDAPAETSYTREDVLAKLKEVSSVHGKPAATKVLKTVGECTGLSDLSDDKFDAVISALQELLDEDG